MPRRQGASPSAVPSRQFSREIVCTEVREEEPVEEGERRGDRLKLEHLDLFMVVKRIHGGGVDGMSCES